MSHTTSVIEYLRQKMIETAERAQSFTDPAVIAVSQRLDQFLVQEQQLQRRAPMSADHTGTAPRRALESTWGAPLPGWFCAVSPRPSAHS
ncbi:MAG: aspartyl-phosphate phosphatase Spo0E family protein [Alicyclobacillus sp.]|nr:aspartyl-phosphate phosphatase Spo0E family protein [Alicyclobacillus sp.]